jgi:hypothetical protein
MGISNRQNETSLDPSHHHDNGYIRAPIDRRRGVIYYGMQRIFTVVVIIITVVVSGRHHNSTK